LARRRRARAARVGEGPAAVALLRLLMDPLAPVAPERRSLFRRAWLALPRWKLAVRIVAAAVAAGAGLWQLSLLLRFYAGRVRYPWDVEWLESTVLYQAYRVMKGMSTYGPPRDGYLPHNHPPGFPAMLGLLGKVFGLDYPMARTISLLCFLGASALV